jgi:hypothetical protein
MLRHLLFNAGFFSFSSSSNVIYKEIEIMKLPNRFMK